MYFFRAHIEVVRIWALKLSFYMDSLWGLVLRICENWGIKIAN